MNSINKNIGRVSLHDGLINSISRGSESIVIDLSHGYLSNYEEGEINEPVMFSDAVLSFSGVKNEYYKSSLEKIHPTLHTVEMPEDFDTEYELIAGNALIAPDALCLQVFRREFEEGKYYYVEWNIGFGSFKLEFDKYILHSDWLKGEAL